jgi:4-hydroxy-tetrahydrodipicolinate synthase
MQGLYTAIVTPFKNDLSLNKQKLKELIAFQAAGGVDGIVPGGTTGENPTFSEKEFREIFEICTEFADFHNIKVVAGCGSNDTLKAVSLCKMASQVGADSALVITPYYNKPNQEGLYRHFSEVAEKSPIPIVMYNVPSRTGVNLLPDTVERLAIHDNIIALKEASGSMSQVQKIIFAVEDKISILSGEDDLIYSMMALGGKGGISVTSNIIPKQMSMLVHAMLNGDFEKGLQLAKYTNELCQTMFIDTNPIPVKKAMELLGLETGPTRLPLTELSDSNIKHLTKILTKYKLIK